MIAFVYDSETNGFVNEREAPTHPSQPHLVQLAGLLLNLDSGEEIQEFSFIIRPDGWTIPYGAAKAHGITTEKATKFGVPLALAVAAFTNLRGRADMTAAHNINFDQTVMAAALHRCGRSPAHPGPARHICTMAIGTEYCKFPPTARMVAAGRQGQYKTANLTELHIHLFGQPFAGAHNAMNDVRATARCLLEFRRLRVIT